MAQRNLPFAQIAHNFKYIHKIAENFLRYTAAMSNFTLLVAAASAVTFVATGGYALAPRHWYDPACSIKGNISINSGEKIYHVPGQENYAATKISSRYGERWFCTEEDARAAGWRKAGR